MLKRVWHVFSGLGHTRKVAGLPRRNFLKFGSISLLLASRSDAAEPLPIAQLEPRVLFVADLARLPPPRGSNITVWVGGFHYLADGGGGLFYWDQNCTDPDKYLAIRPAMSEVGAWVRNRDNGLLDVRWFGAKGDGRSDDTAAFNAALTYMKAVGQAVAAPSDPVRPTMRIPAGVYRVRPLEPLTKTQNIRIIGEGFSATKIILMRTADGQPAVFQMGLAVKKPSDQWGGGAQGLEIRDLSIGCEQGNHNDTPYGIGIQDFGCGGILLERVRFWGLSYAIQAPYGSDFSRFIDCNFRHNDCGIYLGPGSQQVSLVRLDFAANRRAIVLDAVPQGEIQSCYFVDQSEIDIEFSNTAASRPTELGVLVSQKIYRGMFAVKDCWFETGTAYAHSFMRRAHIHSAAASGEPWESGPGGIQIIRSFLVSGSKNMLRGSNPTFWLIESGVDNKIEDVRIWGQYVDSIVVCKNQMAVSVSGITHVQDTR